MHMLWAEWILTKTNPIAIECASQAIKYTSLRVISWPKQKPKLNLEQILFQDIIKQINSGNWKQCLEAEKGFEQQRCTDYTQWNHLQRCCSFHSTQTTTLGFDKSTWDTSWEECNWGISQNDSSVAWHYPRRSTFVKKCKNRQMNRPSLRITVSTWPEADVWERFHVDWACVTD